MPFTLWLSLAAVCAMGAMSPGPSLAMVLRHTLGGGRAPGVIAGVSHALGVGFYDPPQDAASAFPERYRGGAFAVFRGSWNRSEGTGYKVVFIPFEGAEATGGYEDFLTGFLVNPSGPDTFARPVGLQVLPDGSLLLAEDGNNRIYRISYEGK